MLVVVAGCFGLLLGSFVNVLIARVPAGEDWVRGSSRCPKCRHDLAWYDNIPLLSWVVLRARCRYCSARISARYPVVEVLVAGLVVAVAVQHGVSVLTLALVYLAAISVALAFIDADTQRLPDAIVLPALVALPVLLALDAALSDGWGNLARAGAGCAILGGFYGLMWLVYPPGLGLGDLKVAALLGFVLGYIAWPALAVGAIAGPLLGGGVVVVGLATRRLNRRSRVPYGPALLSGAWIGILAGSLIGHAYLRLVVPG